MEDGVTVGVSLQRPGKIMFHWQFECTNAFVMIVFVVFRKTGESIRDLWHKADGDAVKKDPTKIRLPRGERILKYNSHRFAENNFDRVAKKVRQGRTLKDFDDSEHLAKLTKESADEIGVAA